jgi:small subunit ribosomal protein S2
MANVNLAQLVGAGVHFGHKANRWNPKMFPYIYEERDGIHILDLVQTVKLLEKACKFVNVAAKKKKIFLFVGTKQQAANTIAQEAQKEKEELDKLSIQDLWERLDLLVPKD